MKRAVLAGACLATILTGCATTQADYDQAVQRVILSALSDPLSDIEARANADDGQAEYALSIIYVFGLRGKEKNLQTAGVYRAKAVRQRDRQQVRRYQGATSTQAGGYVARSEPVFHWVASHAGAINKCTMALSADSPSVDKYCIGERTVDELKALWAKAKAE